MNIGIDKSASVHECGWIHFGRNRLSGEVKPQCRLARRKLPTNDYSARYQLPGADHLGVGRRFGQRRLWGVIVPAVSSIQIVHSFWSGF